VTLHKNLLTFHKNLVPLVPKGSLQEQKEEENQGELANPALPQKLPLTKDK